MLGAAISGLCCHLLSVTQGLQCLAGHSKEVRPRRQTPLLEEGIVPPGRQTVSEALPLTLFSLLITLNVSPKFRASSRLDGRRVRG